MHQKRHEIDEQELQGFKYFKVISALREKLHEVGCERDRAHNRLLPMDQYVSRLLLYMFNPICTSLRALQQASELKKVQQKLGVRRASLGSLSEAATVFDSQQRVRVLSELGQQLQLLAVSDKLQDLPGILTAVDGTLLKALPRITWALWLDEQHKAVKNPVHFEILKGVPVAASRRCGPLKCCVGTLQAWLARRNCWPISRVCKKSAERDQTVFLPGERSRSLLRSASA